MFWPGIRVFVYLTFVCVQDGPVLSKHVVCTSGNLTYHGRIFVAKISLKLTEINLFLFSNLTGSIFFSVNDMTPNICNDVWCLFAEILQTSGTSFPNLKHGYHDC